MGSDPVDKEFRSELKRMLRFGRVKGKPIGYEWAKCSDVLDALQIQVSRCLQRLDTRKGVQATDASRLLLDTVKTEINTYGPRYALTLWDGDLWIRAKRRHEARE